MKKIILLTVALFFVSMIGIGLLFHDQTAPQSPSPRLARETPRAGAVKPEVETPEPASAPALTTAEIVKQNAQPPAGFAIEAYRTAQEVCRRSLKSPSQAKFSNPVTESDSGYELYGYYQWKAFGRVESQNSFGAFIQERWQAVVQYNTGAFQVVYLKIGDNTSGEMPALRRAPGF